MVICLIIYGLLDHLEGKLYQCIMLLLHGIDSINYSFLFLFLYHDAPPSKRQMKLKGSINDKETSFYLFHQIIIFSYRSNLVSKIIVGCWQLNFR